MTYEVIMNFIESDATGIAKGYEYGFLQNFYSLEKLKTALSNDLILFAKIEQGLLAKNTPSEGDFIEYEEGKFARISRLDNGCDSFQISNAIGVYVWIGNSGGSGSQASGATWDPSLDFVSTERLKIQNLQETSETKKGRCWTFSGNQSGAGRGVYFELNFKVWRLSK